MTNAYNPTPLTRDNAALVLVDNQVGLMTGVRDYPIAELKHNIVGLAKSAKALGLPIVTTTTSSETLWGPAIPELKEALARPNLHRPDDCQRLGRSKGGRGHSGHGSQQTDLRGAVP